MNRCLMVMLCLMGLLHPAAIVGAKEIQPLNFGVLRQHSQPQRHSAWRVLAEYLSRQLPGCRVQVRVLESREMFAALQRQQLDFVLTDPSQYIFLKEKNGLSAPLATMVRMEGSRPLNRVGGVIFARSNRDDIGELVDVKGKKIACMSADAGILGGFAMQAFELYGAGISLEPRQVVIAAPTPEQVVRSVREDKADVGFVHAGLIEQLERYGKITAGSLKIINRQSLPDFPFASSTRLYPEWVCAAAPHADGILAARIAAALQRIKPGTAVLDAAQIHAFISPADYHPVEALLRELSLPPYDKTRQFNMADVWRRDWLRLAGLVVAISGVVFIHRRLTVSQLRLKTVLGELKRQKGRLREAKDRADAANRALRLLSASNGTLLRSPAEGDHLLQVCRIAVEDGGYAAAWVGMVRQDEEKTIAPVACFGFEKEWPEEMGPSLPGKGPGAGVVEMAIQSGAVQVRVDILNDPSMAICHEHARTLGVQATIALPLRVQGEVIGALSICAPEPHAFQPDEVALLRELADDLAFGLQTMRMREAHVEAQEHVRQLSCYDRLTGVANRFLFLEQLERNVRAATGMGQAFMLARVDLIHLREISETHGHVLADQLVMRAARELQAICGQDCLLARIGGDDFTLISPDAAPRAVELLGKKIYAALSAPVFLSGHRYVIGCGMGIVTCPEDGWKEADLLSKVEMAASRAKQAGGGVCFYRPEMGEHLARTMILATRLEDSIHENMLELFYQVKVELQTGRMVGAEALLRWHDPELGWISPAEFIPIAESRGLMPALGYWVLRTACWNIRQWHDEGVGAFGKIAVNISARQLESPAFLVGVSDILAETGVSADCLELELTESILMTDPERINGILRELKSRGFSIALDDFGTGYSSLAYLKHFPLDTIKIDREFVRDMLVDQNDRAIVSTIVTMAQQLGLATVAEGVEQEEQSHVLRQLGCLQAQGFYFSCPEPADEFRKKRLMGARLRQA